MSGKVSVRLELTRRDWLVAASLLALVLLIAFSPAVFGGRTLLLGSWDAPSIMSSGAYGSEPRPTIRLQRTPDPGAAAWQTEPWFQLESNAFWSEFSLHWIQAGTM